MYSPTASLKIHFVYDQRSALQTQITILQNQLDSKNTTLAQQIRVYEADVSSLEQRLATFNARVHEVNQSGGASQDEYDSLVAEQNDLNAQGEALNARASLLNLGTRNYNATVENLNNNVNQFNVEITQKPEEGLYDADDNTITIYFATNRQELIHTVAHEFGHVLRMVHTQDRKDIMYPSASSTLLLTAKDTEQLTYICREQLLPVHWLKIYSDWLHSTVRFLSGYTPIF